nr:MAG TPA: hypothetical protein [Caudoviricetes sp.]
MPVDRGFICSQIFRCTPGFNKVLVCGRHHD